jgi:hypothetical protein
MLMLYYRDWDTGILAVPRHPNTRSLPQIHYVDRVIREHTALWNTQKSLRLGYSILGLGALLGEFRDGILAKRSEDRDH